MIEFVHFLDGFFWECVLNQICPVVKVVVPPWWLKKNISVLHVLHGILAEASLIVPDLAISVYVRQFM